MTYYIKSTIHQSTGEGIYVAKNGRGYIRDNELHLISPAVHYIFRFFGNQVGWFMRNEATMTDYFLGAGASPTINLEDLEIKDVAYWNEINYIPEAEVQ